MTSTCDAAKGNMSSHAYPRLSPAGRHSAPDLEREFANYLRSREEDATTL